MERRDGKSQHHPRADPVHKMELMEKIWELKKEFWTFREIGEELGISDKTAWKYFHEFELFLAPPSLEQERLMHIQQIEEMLARAHRLLARAPDVETELKVLAEIRAWMKDHRHFLGLNAAKKYEVKHKTTTETDENIEQLLEQFEADYGDSEATSDRRRSERRARFRE